jgi:hypothetical protein
VSIRSCGYTGEQKELARVSQRPIFGCEVTLIELGQDSLIVVNSGGPESKVRIESAVYFVVVPAIDSAGQARRQGSEVRCLVRDYYRDRLSGDYDGSTRRVFGRVFPTLNYAFCGALADQVKGALGGVGLTYGGLYVERVIKVESWDTVRHHSVAYFTGLSSWAGLEVHCDRISDQRGRELLSVRDSLGAAGVMDIDPSRAREYAGRIAQSCVATLADKVRR